MFKYHVFQTVSMTTVRTTAYSIVGLMLLSIFASFGGLIADNEKVESELKEEPTQFQATSPGHAVFAEYMGAYWCGPCKTTSTNLHNLYVQTVAVELNLKISPTSLSGNLQQQVTRVTAQSTDAPTCKTHLDTQAASQLRSLAMHHREHTTQ